MKSINSMLLIGNVVGEISVTKTSNSSVANFTVSVSKRQMTDTGPVTKTTYTRVCAWGGLAKKVESLKEGEEVIVEGTIENNSYEKDGETFIANQIRANNVSPTNTMIYGNQINEATICGYTGEIQDSKIKEFDGNIMAISFSVATNRYVKKDDEEFDEYTTWHNVRLYVSKEFYKNEFEKFVGKKGIPIFLKGLLKTNSYDSESGVKKYFTAIFVKEDGIIGIFSKSKVVSNENSEEVEEEKTVKKTVTKTTKSAPKPIKQTVKEEPEEEEISIEDIPF